MPVVTSVSQATRPVGSWRITSSSTASEIWSATLSGCPSVTDSEVKRRVCRCLLTLVLPQSSSGPRLAQRLRQCRHDLEEVADDSVVGDVEDGGSGVLVDGYRAVGALHSDQVLD